MEESLIPRIDPANLVESFFAGRNPRTLKAYNQAIRNFGQFAGVRSPSDLAKKLFGSGPGAANHLVIEYRNRLREMGKTPATINQHLAAIRSFVKFAKTLGMIPWDLTVRGEKQETYRDTKGPGVEGFKRILAEAVKQGGKKAIRDKAMLRVMWDLGLRNGEMTGLDVPDIDFNNDVIWILGKGRKQKEKLTLPPETKDVLREWIGDRRTGAVFTNLDHRYQNGNHNGSKRLTGTGVWKIVTKLGKRCGVVARPHGVRHAAITFALDITKGDVRAVRKFSRHKNIQTLMVYDDSREDMGGQIARKISEKTAERGLFNGIPG